MKINSQTWTCLYQEERPRHIRTQDYSYMWLLDNACITMHAYGSGSKRNLHTKAYECQH